MTGRRAVVPDVAGGEHRGHGTAKPQQQRHCRLSGQPEETQDRRRQRPRTGKISAVLQYREKQKQQKQPRGKIQHRQRACQHAVFQKRRRKSRETAGQKVKKAAKRQGKKRGKAPRKKRARRPERENQHRRKKKNQTGKARPRGEKQAVGAVLKSAPLRGRRQGGTGEIIRPL